MKVAYPSFIVGRRVLRIQLMNRINQCRNHIVGRNIRRLRKKNQLRNKDIVAKLQLCGVDINTSVYSKVELGYNNPSVDMLIALTDILHCDFNDFFEQ